MNEQIPYYYLYVNWYNLDTPLGLYGFVEEMKQDNVDLKKYPEIEVYYNVLVNNSLRDEPNIITVDYTVHKLKCALIRLGFAHTTRKVKGKLFYYWKEKEEEE